MRNKHTPEPWDFEKTYVGWRICIHGNTHITDFFSSNADMPPEQVEANTRRAVACVNALAGIPDPAAEMARLRAVEEENAALRRSLVELMDIIHDDLTHARQNDHKESLDAAKMALGGGA